MSELWSIGEFARRCRLPVSTLRYYHDAGVFLAADVDETTGYRRYHPDQLPIALVLHHLRRIGVSTAEMATLASNPQGADTVLAQVEQRLVAELATRRRALDDLVRVRRLLADDHPTVPQREQRLARRVAGLQGTVRTAHIKGDLTRLMVQLRQLRPPRSPADTRFGAQFPLDLNDDPIEVTVFHNTPAPGDENLTVPGGLHLVTEGAGFPVEPLYHQLLGDSLTSTVGSHSVVEDYRAERGVLITTIAIRIGDPPPGQMSS